MNESIRLNNILHEGCISSMTLTNLNIELRTEIRVNNYIQPQKLRQIVETYQGFYMLVCREWLAEISGRIS